MQWSKTKIVTGKGVTHDSIKALKSRTIMQEEGVCSNKGERLIHERTRIDVTWFGAVGALCLIVLASLCHLVNCSPPVLSAICLQLRQLDSQPRSVCLYVGHTPQSF